MNNLSELSDRELLVAIWKDHGKNILDTIDRQTTKAMTLKEFLGHCTACGGNWGGMLLSGINELYPEVYSAIPDNMGKYAWFGICTVVKLLDINMEEE